MPSEPPPTRYVVQFPHPGGERRPPRLSPGEELAWNTGEHGRKFLHSPATYVDGNGWHSGDVTFWGEWEPPSTITGTLPKLSGHARAVQRPHWPTDEQGWRQNTDPFVFGGPFLYSNCRQYQNSKLRSLADGSLVLFGSKVQHRFVLDTVLVISRQRSYRPIDGIDGIDVADGPGTPAYLAPLVVDPLAASEQDGGRDYRLYEGATPDEPVEGMYSFVPCAPYGDVPAGFARPALELGDLLNHNLAMQVRATATSLTETRLVWDRVVEQVHEAGLSLATRFDLPAHSNAARP